MSQDHNTARVFGTVAREVEVRPMGASAKMYVMVIAGERDIVGNNGKTITLPFYQQVEIRGKEGEEASKLGVGTPVLAEGTVYHRQWDDKEGNKRQATSVRGRTVRAVHGVSPDRVLADAKGNARLKDGYARASVLMRVAGEPDYRILTGGNAVLNFRGGCSDSWAVLEDGALVWKEHTNWLRVAAWGDLAEHLNGLGLTKGCTVLLEGDIENGSYEDRKTGLKTYTTTVNASTVYPIGRRGEAAGVDSIPAKGVSNYSASADDMFPDGEFEFPAEEALPF